MQPNVYCKAASWLSPIYVSSKDGNLADIFPTLVGVAISPLSVMGTSGTGLIAGNYKKEIKIAAVVGAVSAAVLVASVVVYRLTRK